MRGKGDFTAEELAAQMKKLTEKYRSISPTYLNQHGFEAQLYYAGINMDKDEAGRLFKNFSISIEQYNKKKKETKSEEVNDSYENIINDLFIEIDKRDNLIIFSRLS